MLLQCSQMKQVDHITVQELSEMAEAMYGNLVKAVVDFDFIEFDSMINIRPRQNNMSRDVEDENIRSQIIALVKNKVSK